MKITLKSLLNGMLNVLFGAFFLYFFCTEMFGSSESSMHMSAGFVVGIGWCVFIIRIFKT